MAEKRIEKEQSELVVELPRSDIAVNGCETVFKISEVIHLLKFKDFVSIWEEKILSDSGNSESSASNLHRNQFC